MTGSGGGLRAWQNLVLLGLCCWSGAGRAAPNPVQSLRVEAQTTSSITLSWEAPEGLSSQNYTYWVQWTADKTETRNTTHTSFTAEGLEPGSSYGFSTWVEEGGVCSSQQTLNATTAPNPVRSLKVEARTNSSISLIWEVPKGPDPQKYTYWVWWSRDGDQNENRSTEDTKYTAEGLQPASLYEFSVWAEKNGVNGSGTTVQGSTAPNPVRTLRMQARTTSSITLTWDVPEGPDQPNYTYCVRWTGGGDKPENQSTTTTNFTAKALEPGTLYELSVWAEMNAVRGSGQNLSVATVPNAVTNLWKQNWTNSSITLNWTAPLGPGHPPYTYRVSWVKENDVATGTQDTADTSFTLKEVDAGSLYTFDVSAERNGVCSDNQTVPGATAPNPVTITSCISTSGGYGVILSWSCPLGGYETFELQLAGQQAFSQNISSCGTNVPVSGLQPAQPYLATITTISHELKAPPAAVTCWTESTRTESTRVIIGAIVGVFLFLILVSLLLFLLKKRYNKNRKKSAPRSLSISFSEDIPVRDFAEHVRKNEKDTNCGFAEEYQHLSLAGKDQSQTVATASENSTKNRYRNVLPYDWSRVPLKPLGEEPGSDYINASFLPGLWGPREFIAAQGPLPQTVGDFWRLVWEQQSRTLVMLTNCMEFGRVKCEHYWPLDAQPCTHRHLQVTLQGEDVAESWTVRHLKLWHTQERKSLFVRQFHYVAWPDHGVPHSPDPLLAFWTTLRRWLDQTPGGGPPIVHCSAGVGRTGTFIALDVLLRQLQCEGVVGPFSYVRKMRESRPLMVQTEAQYVFLHQCILRFIQQSAPAPAEKAAYENQLFESETH